MPVEVPAIEMANPIRSARPHRPWHIATGNDKSRPRVNQHNSHLHAVCSPDFAKSSTYSMNVVLDVIRKRSPSAFLLRVGKSLWLEVLLKPTEPHAGSQRAIPQYQCLLLRHLCKSGSGPLRRSQMAHSSTLFCNSVLQTAVIKLVASPSLKDSRLDRRSS